MVGAPATHCRSLGGCRLELSVMLERGSLCRGVLALVVPSFPLCKRDPLQAPAQLRFGLKFGRCHGAWGLGLGSPTCLPGKYKEPDLSS